MLTIFADKGCPFLWNLVFRRARAVSQSYIDRSLETDVSWLACLEESCTCGSGTITVSQCYIYVYGSRELRCDLE